MDLRTYYAPEVEQALVALLWHEPDHLGQVQRQLDPEVHLVEPANRVLLEAINIAYREQGACDWATVIEVLRELGTLNEGGGTQALDAIYSRPGYSALVPHYVELLKGYAQQRATDPSRPLSYYTKDIGLLRVALRQPSQQGADFTGTARIAAKSYLVRGWINSTRRELQLRFYRHHDP